MKVYGGRSTIKDECATGMSAESAEEADMLLNLLCKDFTHPIKKPLLTIHVPIKYNQQKYFSDAETECIKEIEDKLLNAFIPPCNDQYPAEINRVIKAFP